VSLGKGLFVNRGGDPWMSVADDVDELIERYQLRLDDFMKGNPEPVKELFSHREDVTLANPLGPQRMDGS
jgi:hypothetical protein